jgi:hypothetical protein
MKTQLHHIAILIVVAIIAIAYAHVEQRNKQPIRLTTGQTGFVGCAWDGEKFQFVARDIYVYSEGLKRLFEELIQTHKLENICAAELESKEARN